MIQAAGEECLSAKLRINGQPYAYNEIKIRRSNPPSVCGAMYNSNDVVFQQPIALHGCFANIRNH